LDALYHHHPDYDYFIMMDFDEPNAKPNVHLNVLAYYLHDNHEWDALSFDTVPDYYDIWALSLRPFCFSYNHFRNTQTNNYHYIQSYIRKILQKCPDDKLIKCISAFNGFGVYRLSAFKHARYDGRTNIREIPEHFIHMHSAAADSPLYFDDLGHVDPQHEECEHRLFHINATKIHGARIMISPRVLFS
jgi:hypothetical protein